MQDAEAFVRFRQRAERIAGMLMHPPRGVSVESAAVGDVPGDWLVPENAPVDPTIVFIMAAGFCLVGVVRTAGFWGTSQNSATCVHLGWIIV